MQVGFFCWFRHGVAGMSRGLGRDVPKRKLWTDFSFPINLIDPVIAIVNWPFAQRPLETPNCPKPLQ